MKPENMFFEFEYVRTSGEKFDISPSFTIRSETENYAKRYAERVVSECRGKREVSLSLILSIPERIRKALGEHLRENNEAYAVEISGAMEYKRHPEINKKWEEFCREVNKSPYEAERIQKKTHPGWQKNSIHADNGNGSFITQDEMRGLMAYCRERGLRVMPEVPSLSHTTDHQRPYKAFYDGFYIVPEDREIGNHIVTYTDGTTAQLPIVFGYNIRSESDGNAGESNSTEAKETGLVEATGASYPYPDGGKTWYRTSYANPYPEKTIKRIECVPRDGIKIEAKYNVL